MNILQRTTLTFLQEDYLEILIQAFLETKEAENEGQRCEIDALHPAYKLWAVQDLRLKRGISQNRWERGILDQGWSFVSAIVNK